MSSSFSRQVALSARLDACAFIATSFGFGPVSKAVSIAQELKAQAPSLQAHYFGAGIDYDFARKSAVFDRLCKVDADRRETLIELLPQLTSYRAVFSILNLDLVRLWKKTSTPLYFVDSLAWMWQSLPEGIENSAAYFVQDYLIPAERISEWSAKSKLVLVAPIETASDAADGTPSSKENQLLINFSGCANPFAPPELYEQYALVLATAILSAAGDDYERIIFCCNQQLASYLQNRLPASSAVTVGHFAHEEFLSLLRSSLLVLSAPGITTTLEAIATRAIVRFLLPQNDSQALLGEQYRSLLGDNACMAFSRFGSEFALPPALPEREKIRFALQSLKTILDGCQPQISGMIRELLNVPSSYSLAPLKQHITQNWKAPGQQAVISHVLSDLTR
jgi:hypothetical protein